MDKIKKLYIMSHFRSIDQNQNQPKIVTHEVYLF